MPVADIAQQLKEAGRRDVRAAPALDRLNQNRADFVFAQRGGQTLLEPGQVGPSTGERDEAGELADLSAKRRAELAAPRGVERAVAKTMISVFERNDAGSTGGQMRRLERGLNCLKAGVAEDRFTGTPG